MLSRTSARQQRMRQQTLDEERMAQNQSKSRNPSERRSSGSKLIISSPTTSSHPALSLNLSNCPQTGSVDGNVKANTPFNRGFGASALLASLSATGQRQSITSTAVSFL